VKFKQTIQGLLFAQRARKPEQQMAKLDRRLHLVWLKSAAENRIDGVL